MGVRARGQTLDMFLTVGQVVFSDECRIRGKVESMITHKFWGMERASQIINLHLLKLSPVLRLPGLSPSGTLAQPTSPGGQA